MAENDDPVGGNVAVLQHHFGFGTGRHQPFGLRCMPSAGHIDAFDAVR